MECYTIHVSLHAEIPVEAMSPEEAQDIAYSLAEDGDLTASMVSEIEIIECAWQVAVGDTIGG